MTRPLFQRPPALPGRGLGFRARTRYTAECIRRAALPVKCAKDCEFEKGLHSSKRGAENPSVGFDRGPNAEVDEVICGEGVSFVTLSESLDSRTSKVSRVLMDGNGGQTENSRDNDAGRRSSASYPVTGNPYHSQAAKNEDEQKSSFL